jgi:hypothetical protein
MAVIKDLLGIPTLYTELYRNDDAVKQTSPKS